MKKNKIILFSFIIFIFLILFACLPILLSNKTFFKNEYVGVNGQKIFIPRYSYFKDECCMTAATFYSLRSKSELSLEINLYLKDFEYFENDTTYGYQKDNLFIQKYEVVDKVFYREIIITY